ncbi:MAG: hypothetical protein DMG76_01760 [Acidobacteria bacterium]|jgi:hypothetical protein|nr:MAG: hypothetical protein DMG76_01760 [Acidobacteriota bacterium]
MCRFRSHLNQFCEGTFQIAIPTARNQRQGIFNKSGLVTETVVNIEGLRLFCVLDGSSAGLDTKFEDIAFLVHGLPEIIRFGDFKSNGLIAD